MERRENRRCLNCGEGFQPDPRNAHHQRYCSQAACKAASRRESQAKWLAKPENHDYHRGPTAVARVRAWRAAHPGYSRRKREKGAALEPEPTILAIPSGAQGLPQLPPDQISCNAPVTPLQALLNAQPAV